MPHRAFTWVALPALLAASGCIASNAELELDGDLPARSCLDLEGDFVAEDVRFTEIGNPRVFEDFGSGADLVLAFEDRDFTSDFLDPDVGPVVRAGTFSAYDDSLVIDVPLLPGIGPGLAAYDCTYDDDALTLTADEVAFDFDGDGVFERATFDGTFVPVEEL